MMPGAAVLHPKSAVAHQLNGLQPAVGARQERQEQFQLAKKNVDLVFPSA